MANIFSKVLLPDGFITDKDLQVAYGSMNGYHVVIKHLPQQRQMVIQYQVLEGNESAAIELRSFLAEWSKKKNVNAATYINNTLSVTLMAKSKQLGELVKETMITITNYLVEHHMEEGCKSCGNKGFEINGIYQINEEVEIMCSECFQRKSANQDSEYKKKTTNMAAGIVGALFGSLLGVICWVLIYQLGYIAGITGFVMVVCCMKGFELLGGKLNRVGVLLSILIAIVMLFAAEYLCVGIEIYKAFRDISDVSIMQAIRAIPFYLTDSPVAEELRNGMLRDLAMGYVFAILASISFIRQSLKATANGVMRKLC